MCTHKAQKYDFCTHQAHFSLILAIWEPPMALIAKMVEKSIKICQIFFVQKINHNKSSGSQFHQKRTKTRDFNLITARHEKFTAPENGTNSKSLNSTNLRCDLS